MDKRLLPDLLVGSLVYAAAAASFVTPGRRRRQAVPIEVWTRPGCSCCHDWIEHLE